MNAVEHAEALAAAGRGEEAFRLLDDAGAGGNVDAMFAQAVWRLAGDTVSRDLAAARTLFGRAADGGHSSARAIHDAFLANGTGGARLWSQALASLRSRSAEDIEARRQIGLLDAMLLDAGGDPDMVAPARRLHVMHDVALIAGFFSRAECDYLISAATPLLQPSVVIDSHTGRMLRDPIRTSEVAAFPLAQEAPAIHALNRRIAAATMTNVTQGEPIQVLSYVPGQQYRAHLDTLPQAQNQRIVTVLVYLNDDYAGGETVFPELDVSVKGNTGDALIFTNVDAVGRPEPLMRHAGVPVRSGRKFVASRWIRAAPLVLS